MGGLSAKCTTVSVCFTGSAAAAAEGEMEEGEVVLMGVVAAGTAATEAEVVGATEESSFSVMGGSFAAGEGMCASVFRWAPTLEVRFFFFTL